MGFTLVKNANYALGENRATSAAASPASVFNRRGVAIFVMGRFEEAIRDFLLVLRLKPDQPLADNNRGNAYYQLGQTERAIEDYDRAIAYELLNKDAEAEQDFVRAIQLGFDSDSLRQDRAYEER